MRPRAVEVVGEEVWKRGVPADLEAERLATEAARRIATPLGIVVPEARAVVGDRLVLARVPGFRSARDALVAGLPAHVDSLGDALARLHDAGLTHGDFSAMNTGWSDVLRQPVLLDWARADWLSEADAARPVTDVAVFLKTLFEGRTPRWGGPIPSLTDARSAADAFLAAYAAVRPLPPGLRPTLRRLLGLFHAHQRRTLGLGATLVRLPRSLATLRMLARHESP